MKKSFVIIMFVLALCAVLSGCSQQSTQPPQDEAIIVVVNGKEFIAEDLGSGVIATPEILTLCRVFQLDPEEWPLDLGDCRQYSVEATEDTSS